VLFFLLKIKISIKTTNWGARGPPGVQVARSLRVLLAADNRILDLENGALAFLRPLGRTLREAVLEGNPCCDTSGGTSTSTLAAAVAPTRGYRDRTIAALAALESLDFVPVTDGERRYVRLRGADAEAGDSVAFEPTDSLADSAAAAHVRSSSVIVPSRASAHTSAAHSPGGHTSSFAFGVSGAVDEDDIPLQRCVSFCLFSLWLSCLCVWGGGVQTHRKFGRPGELPPTKNQY
jgi:hypothetical protein